MSDRSQFGIPDILLIITSDGVPVIFKVVTIDHQNEEYVVKVLYGNERLGWIADGKTSRLGFRSFITDAINASIEPSRAVISVFERKITA